MYGTAFAADSEKWKRYAYAYGRIRDARLDPRSQIPRFGSMVFAVELGQKSKTQNVAVGFLFNLLRPMSSSK